MKSDNFYKDNTYYKRLVLILIVLLSLFSPYAAFILGAIFLYFSANKSDKHIQIAYSILIAFSGSVIVSSRSVALVGSNMSKYYEIYINSFNESYSDTNMEIGFRLVYYVLYYFFEVVDLPIFIFMHSFTISLLYIVLLFKLLKKYFHVVDSRVISIALLMFSYTLSTHLTRYFIATLMLAFVLLLKKKVSKLILLVSAMLFHSASIFLYLFYYFSIKETKKTVIFGIPFILYISLNFQNIGSFLVNSSIPGFHKLTYAIGSGGFLFPSIFSIIYVLVSIIIVYVFLYPSLKKTKIPVFGLIVVPFLFGLSLLPVASLPLRLLFPITMFLNVVIYGLLLRRFKIWTSFMLFMFLIAYKMNSYSGLGSNLTNKFWESYPPVSYIPLYYFFNT
jgi:hypothetical protein